LNVDNKISPLPIWRKVRKLQNHSVQLRNSNKQLIPAKFYVNNAAFIINQNAKFQSTLSTQTIVTLFFVR